jgi:hypothetical protein
MSWGAFLRQIEGPDSPKGAARAGTRGAASGACCPRVQEANTQEARNRTMALMGFGTTTLSSWVPGLLWRSARCVDQRTVEARLRLAPPGIVSCSHSPASWSDPRRDAGREPWPARGHKRQKRSARNAEVGHEEGLDGRLGRTLKFFLRLWGRFLGFRLVRGLARLRAAKTDRPRPARTREQRTEGGDAT